MTPIPKPLLKEILADPYYKTCARASEGSCDGRITFEHSLIFASKQVQKKFAIIPLCTFHHAVDEYQDGGDLDKDRNVQIALNRATDLELQEISKVINYFRMRELLNKRYGK